jgi:hypothetical protein
LRRGLAGARVELLGGQRAERMRHHDRAQRVHAERRALHRRLVLEDRRDDDG